MKISDQNCMKNMILKHNFQKTKNFTVKNVYKMINTKYEVDPTLELGYLGVKKMVDYFLRQFKHLNTFSRDFLPTAIQLKRISRIFRNFPKCVQLRGAVSPSSMNIFLWDQYRWKDLCISFKTRLIRAKTDPWRQSYS